MLEASGMDDARPRQPHGDLGQWQFAISTSGRDAWIITVIGAVVILVSIGALLSGGEMAMAGGVMFGLLALGMLITGLVLLAKSRGTYEIYDKGVALVSESGQRIILFRELTDMLIDFVTKHSLSTSLRVHLRTKEEVFKFHHSFLGSRSDEHEKHQRLASFLASRAPEGVKVRGVHGLDQQ